MPPRIATRPGQAPIAPQQCLQLRNNCSSRTPSQTRQFSHASPQQFHASCRQATRLRRNMYAWLNGPGRVFREPLPNSTNYLGAYDRSGNLLRLRNNASEEDEVEEAGQSKEERERKALERQQTQEEEEDEGLDEFERQQRREQREADAADQEENRGRRENKLPQEKANDLRPFPLNRDFRSQSVLSEDLREELWRKVVEEKQTVATVSAAFGVDMRRVAAVVRLKEVEKNWIKQGQQLAKPYASAVLAMLPQTPFPKNGKITAHESINDLPVHPSTRQQIFYPVSESRQFTRADAAKVFSPTLLPADERIPHPELIESERNKLADMPREARLEIIRAKDQAQQKVREDKERKQREWEARALKKVQGQRWDFKFQDVSVESAGRDGRGKAGVGWRYGMPHNDRRRGQVKIPTFVE